MRDESLPIRVIETEVSVLRRRLAEMEDERIQLETQLSYAREHMCRFEMLLAHSNDIIFFIRRSDARILEANTAATRAHGFSREELLSMTIFELRLPQERELVQSQLAMADENGIVFETVHRKKDGSLFAVEVSAEASILGSTRTLISVIRDISGRKRADHALKQSEERFRSLVEQSILGISLIDQNGRYHYVNPRFVDMFGYTLQDIPTGRQWFRKAFPKARHRQQIIATWLQYCNGQRGQYSKAIETKIYNVTCSDRSCKVVNFKAVKLTDGHHLIIYDDVTESRKVEEHLNRAQKMEAIGTLAGGIAHDFNNILMGIEGRSSLMLTEIEPHHPHVEHLRSIESYIKSATELTRQLMEFARGGKYEPKPTNLNELVQESAEMFGRTRKEIRITKKFEPNPWPVEADRNQLEQVLLNLYVNAWQAMPCGGELNLATRNVKLKEHVVRPYQLPAGRYVEIVVIDSGVGMDEKTMKRIFDPFFTTKELGKGSGLGLASTYGIIKNHRGIITVSSRKDQGARFSIYLPATRKKVAAQAPKAVSLSRGRGTIMVVDDEQMVTEVLEPMLTRLGYETLICWSGREAVEVFKERKDEVDLVILDMIMPDMGGADVYDHLKSIRPGTKILLSSGYSIQGQAATILARGCDGFIQKPFNINELSEKVKEILA
jgi:two-component system, cell cycle sensor histidine kinase and response regulator CckA